MTNAYLEQIYRQYYSMLFLFALSLSGSRADAEDLVANTFVKAMLSYEGGNLKVWLYTVLKNEYYNTHKKRQRIHNNGDSKLAQAADTTDILKDIIREEEKRWLYQQIYQLPGREREIMLLSIQSDLNDAAIAAIMGISINQLRVIRHRTRQKLIKLCKEEDRL